MAHIKDDTDTSVSRDSVFDWGFSSRDSVSKGSNSKSEDASGKNDSSGPPPSRYDPKAMSRIVDITDLVDDSDDGDSDIDDVMGSRPSTGPAATKKRQNPTKTNGNKKRTRSSYQASMLCRQVIILTALVAIIAGASMAIGYAVIGFGDHNVAKNSGNAQLSSANDDKSLRGEQKKLEIAERITVACAESKLNQDMKECQKLCKSSMCCFEGSESKYSCQGDDSKNCAVYAGCKALVDGKPLGAADEEEG